MTIILWVLQAGMAGIFLFAGGNKLFKSYEDIIKMLPGMADLPPAAVKTIGLLEVLGAIGLILPVATGILPWLTPLAAFGLALTMIGAALFHLRRHESIVVNVVFLGITLFITYGLLVLEPVVS